MPLQTIWVGTRPRESADRRGFFVELFDVKGTDSRESAGYIKPYQVIGVVLRF